MFVLEKILNYQFKYAYNDFIQEDSKQRLWKRLKSFTRHIIYLKFTRGRKVQKENGIDGINLRYGLTEGKLTQVNSYSHAQT